MNVTYNCYNYSDANHFIIQLFLIYMRNATQINISAKLECLTVHHVVYLPIPEVSERLRR